MRGDNADFIAEASIELEHEDNGLYHRAVHVEATTTRGEAVSIEGRVQCFLPLRHRRAGMTTHVGEGMTEWRFGDRVGYGLSEVLRQVA